MGGRFRLLDDGAASGAWNMSLDEALLACAPDSGPTLRLYAWSQPTLSLGYRQAEPPWLERCAALGVDVVRRASGGGAVLHAGDLTYCVTAPCRDAGLPEDLRGSYEWIRARLVAGLRSAGVAARAARGRADAARLELCFAGSTGYEVELEGRKLIGSAQRRTRHAFLQHGSIRVADDAALYRALTGETPEPPPAPGVAAEALRAALVRSFEVELGFGLETGTLSPAERSVAESRAACRARAQLSAPAFP